MARAAAKPARQATAQYAASCQEVRRVREPGGPWRTEKCGVYLGSETLRAAGRCQWCIDGHSHEDNQPAPPAGSLL